MNVIRTVSAALQENPGEELDELARECRVVIRERAFTGRTPLLLLVATLPRKPDATWADFHLTACVIGSRNGEEQRAATSSPATPNSSKILTSLTGCALKSCA